MAAEGPEMELPELGPEPPAAAAMEAVEEGGDEVEQKVSVDTGKAVVEERRKKTTETDGITVEYGGEDVKKLMPWSTSSDYDVKTVYVDLENYKNAIPTEGTAHKNITIKKEQGEEGEEGDEEEYYLVEEEEIIEEGVEDAQSEGGLNAEEREEQLEAIKVHRKRKDYEVFVGGLDWYATEDDIKEVFNAAGEVREVRLTTNARTKKNEGFAFVRYGTVEEAKRALDLKGSVVRGKRCRVFPSEENDTLFMSNICRTWTKEQFEEKLKEYGVDHYKDLTLVEDRRNEGLNRGFAFLEFFSRVDAKLACRRLKAQDANFGLERGANVMFAVSYLEPDGKTMSQIRTVFINGMPPELEEDQVREIFEKFGPIKRVQLAKNLRSAKRRDFAFIIFEDHKDAISCVKSTNNSYVGEGDNKRKVGVTLYWPRPWRERLRLKRVPPHGYRCNSPSSRRRSRTRRLRSHSLSPSLSPSRSPPARKSRARISMREEGGGRERDRLALVPVEKPRRRGGGGGIRVSVSPERLERLERRRGSRVRVSVSPERAGRRRSSRVRVSSPEVERTRRGNTRVRVSHSPERSRRVRVVGSPERVRRVRVISSPERPSRRIRVANASPDRPYDRRISGHEYYPKRREESSRRPPTDYDSSSRATVERRFSYRDEYYYHPHPSERPYSSRHDYDLYKDEMLVSYRDRDGGHFRDYERGRGPKHQYVDMDDDAYEDVSIHRTKPRLVYGSSSGASCNCARCLEVYSRRAHVEYCTARNCVYCRDEMYDRHDVSYSRGAYSSQSSKRGGY